ncbi:MAG: hypothetical protein ACFB2X_06755 [Rivularia sp. (in: cyanobacteria)]
MKGNIALFTLIAIQILPHPVQIFTDSDSTASISPSNITNVEFSDGNSFGVNSPNTENQTSTSESKSKQQGSRSRVMIR